MNPERSLPEGVALPYRIRRSATAQAVPVGRSESYRLGAIAAYFPWHGLAVTTLLLAGWGFLSLLLPISDQASGLGFCGSLVLGLAACSSELSFRRDRLTATGLERRAGQLGRRLELIRYADCPLRRKWTVVPIESGQQSERSDALVILR